LFLDLILDLDFRSVLTVW